MANDIVLSQGHSDFNGRKEEGLIIPPYTVRVQTKHDIPYEFKAPLMHAFENVVHKWGWEGRHIADEYILNLDSPIVKGGILSNYAVNVQDVKGMDYGYIHVDGWREPLENEKKGLETPISTRKPKAIVMADVQDDITLSKDIKNMIEFCFKASKATKQNWCIVSYKGKIYPEIWTGNEDSVMDNKRLFKSTKYEAEIYFAKTLNEQMHDLNAYLGSTLCAYVVTVNNKADIPGNIRANYEAFKSAMLDSSGQKRTGFQRIVENLESKHRWLVDKA